MEKKPSTASMVTVGMITLVVIILAIVVIMQQTNLENRSGAQAFYEHPIIQNIIDK